MEPTSELFFALVAPVGVSRQDVLRALEESLRGFAFKVVHIRLSELLKRATNIWTPPDAYSEATRIRHLQKLGNKFRESTRNKSAMALAALAAIREKRAILTGSPNKPAARVAYVIDQLKNPFEMKLLRDVYGSCFFSIAGHAPYSLRETNLAGMIARSEGRANDVDPSRDVARKIIRDDDTQNDDYGQNTRDTYPLADLFVDLEVEGAAGSEINRFVELIFGHPFHTPSIEEHAMHQASSVSLRSSDESRQVGAAIMTVNGDVIALGANEVPMKGGGLYWPNQSPDARDQNLVQKNEDRAADIKSSALRELLERLDNQNLLVSSNLSINERARDLLPFLKGTQFLNIGEFSRPVHAEMAALIDAAKRGVSIDKHIMYVTTFPCHNCAKHIIASGIKAVVYLEPYPKSHAKLLYAEEIELDPKSNNRDSDESYGNRLVFYRFSGLAPRQFRRLFSMDARGAKNGFALSEWYSRRDKMLPVYTDRNAGMAYVISECDELKKLPSCDFEWDQEKVCPDDLVSIVTG